MKNIARRLKPFATLASLMLTAAPARAQAPPPDLQQVNAVAAGFYAAYSTFHPSDGIPDAKGLAKYRPYISPPLDRLLLDGEAAERRFSAATKNMSPPLIEGDLFTSNFEGATSYRIGPCNSDADAAHCAVTLGYRGSNDAKPLDWTDTIWLVRTMAGWKVDDIAYGGNAAFGNKGRLKETLQNAIRDGNDAAR